MMPKRSIIPVFVPHLGCPNDCVFCNQRRISGQKTKQTGDSVRHIVLESFLKIPETYEKELAFYGGSFTAIPVQEQEELLNAVLPFLHSGTINALRVSTRPDAINEDAVERLKKFGVKTVELGAQSMCDEVLQLSGRGHTAADTEKAAAMLKDAGFNLILQMMTGLPGDTFERSVYTAGKIADMMPDGVRIYPTVVIRDTALFDMWQAGSYMEHTVEDAVELCSEIVGIFETAGITIIRMGLNPTEELSVGAAAAGAYHPAFGELVYSRIYLKKARKLLRETSHGKDIVFGVSKSSVSMMTGQKKCNISAMKSEFNLNSVKIRGIDVENGEVRLLSN